MMQAPNEFREAIAEGEIAEAIQLLYKLVADRGDRETEHQLIIINFDFQEYERGIKNGWRDPGRSREIYNQINHSLLDLYEELSATRPTDRVEPILLVDENFKATILAGEIDSAIQILEQEIEARGDREAEKSLLLIQANSLEVKRDTIGALSSEDNLRIRKNRVVKSLLDLRQEVYANREASAPVAPRKVNEVFKRLLAMGELGKAVEWLDKTMEGNIDPDLQANLILLQKQIAELKRHQNLATLSPEELKLRKNRLISNLWDLYQNLEEEKKFPPTEEENGIFEDQAIKKWSLEGALLSGFGGPKANIASLAVAGDWVLSTDKRGNYKVYENGKSVPTQGSPGSTASTAIFLPPGSVRNTSQPRNYLVGYQEGVIRTYKPRGKMINEVNLNIGPINSLASSPVSEQVLVGTSDHRAALYAGNGDPVIRLGEAGELFQTELFGRNSNNATSFLHLVPPGARLVSLTINAGTLIDQIKIKYRNGKDEDELVIGEANGSTSKEFYINAPITKITGRAGDDLDQLQFHFQDDTKTPVPVYGGNGGKPFEVAFDEMELAGFHGQQSDRGWISQLGFFGRAKPEEPLHKAKSKA